MARLVTPLNAIRALGVNALIVGGLFCLDANGSITVPMLTKFASGLLLIFTGLMLYRAAGLLTQSIDEDRI